MSTKPTRREFLGTTGVAAAGWAGAKLYAADADAKPGPSEIVNLANISWRVGRRIRFDGEKERIIDDPGGWRPAELRAPRTVAPGRVGPSGDLTTQWHYTTFSGRACPPPKMLFWNPERLL